MHLRAHALVEILEFLERDMAVAIGVDAGRRRAVIEIALGDVASPFRQTVKRRNGSAGLQPLFAGQLPIMVGIDARDDVADVVIGTWFGGRRSRGKLRRYAQRGEASKGSGYKITHVFPYALAGMSSVRAAIGV